MECNCLGWRRPSIETASRHEIRNRVSKEYEGERREEEREKKRGRKEKRRGKEEERRGTMRGLKGKEERTRKEQQIKNNYKASAIKCLGKVLLQDRNGRGDKGPYGEGSRPEQLEAISTAAGAISTFKDSLQYGEQEEGAEARGNKDGKTGSEYILWGGHDGESGLVISDSCRPQRNASPSFRIQFPVFKHYRRDAHKRRSMCSWSFLFRLTR